MIRFFDIIFSLIGIILLSPIITILLIAGYFDTKSPIFCQERMGKNKKVFMLKPSLIYGHEKNGNLNLLYKLVIKRIPWPLGAFYNRIIICFVKNNIFIVEKQK